jgi:cysteine desulfuration protein SufE
MNSDKIQDAIIEEFSIFDDWLDKYDYLISLSDQLEAMDPTKRTERHLIDGCQSRVWVSSELKDGKMFYSADSDAIITKGIISLLIGLYSGRTPQEIFSSDFSVVEKIGLKENLSPTRANGLVSMIAKIKQIASENL